MSTIKIVFVECSGAEKVVEDAQPGESIMQVATANGIEGILGECGGGCACAETYR